MSCFCQGEGCNKKINPSIEGEKAGGKGGRPGPCIGFARFFFFMPTEAAYARTGKVPAQA